MKFDTVIIGAGLGGLQCAYILSKHGQNVCVVEKNPQIGGCLQTFKRGQQYFDTGFHYIGGLSSGQPLYRLFDYFQLLDLPWYQLDTNAFDEVVFGEKSYYFANGYQQFADTMSEYFPHERANLKQYASFLQQVGENIFHIFDNQSTNGVYNQSLFSLSAYEFLQKSFKDETLRQVLSGTALKMELHAETLPLYVFAQINSSMIQSAWRLRGGGQQIAEALQQHIENMGGTVLKNAQVIGFDENESGITAAILKNGEKIEARHFISDIHPYELLNLLVNSKFIRKIYRGRIEKLADSFAMFTVNCALKKDTIPYLNRNQYIYKTKDVWQISRHLETTPQGVLISYQTPKDENNFTQNIDLLTPVSWSEFAQWSNSKPMKRAKDYEDLKQQKAEQCIGIASQYIPHFRENITKIYTSTPLTYAYYTGTRQGSAFGIKKDYNNLIYTILTPKTPVPNLLMTGQNLTLHGILGVSMTSFFTCSEIIGKINPFEYKK